MTIYNQQLDVITGKPSFGPTYSEAAVQVVADGGVTAVSLVGLLTLTSTCLLQVFRNGQDLFEGASLDYTRDVTNNQILFNYTIPKNAKLKFRVYRG